MKYIVFNPESKMYYFSIISRKLCYTKDKESAVAFDTKQQADIFIEITHFEYDKQQLVRHNLISIPYEPTKL